MSRSVDISAWGKTPPRWVELLAAEVRATDRTQAGARILNTDRRIIRPGESGVAQDSEIESHGHALSLSPAGGHRHSVGGVGGSAGADSGSSWYPSAQSTVYTSTAPDHVHEGTADNTGGDETRMSNEGCSVYVRIF